MAKNKKQNLEMTPLMMLSAMAFFFMVPIVLSVSNSNKTPTTTEAKTPQEVVVVAPTETPDATETIEY